MTTLARRPCAFSILKAAAAAAAVTKAPNHTEACYIGLFIKGRGTDNYVYNYQYLQIYHDFCTPHPISPCEQSEKPCPVFHPPRWHHTYNTTPFSASVVCTSAHLEVIGADESRTGDRGGGDGFASDLRRRFGGGCSDSSGGTARLPHGR